MKLFRPLLVTLILGAFAFCRPLAAQGTPAADEVNLDFFYTNLQDKGDWLQTEEYGYVFRPKIGAEKPDWRPYTDGFWAHTDEGWLWNSYEDFGWATYHYGRWSRLKDYGWVWVPGFEWAPAWVAWRGTSPDGGDTSEAPPPADAKSTAQVNYIGWAPLPPEARFEENVGFNAAVDYNYGLAPDYYNFVPVSSFGDPYLAPLVIAPLLAYGFWASTYGYTNYAYNNYGWGRGVYVGGPRYGYYNAFAARPINQYNIQRNVAFANGGVNNFRPGRPVNGVMPVFAPRVAPVTAANRAAFKPAVVKATVPAGQVQKGWDAAKGNPAQVAQAKAVTQAQAVKAAPAKLPPAQVRAVTPVGGVPKATTNAINTGAPGAAVPKNQLSPQNAAQVQSNQAAKGFPATVPTGPNAGAPKTGVNAAKAGTGQLPAVQTPATTNAAIKGGKVQTESATRTTSTGRKTTASTGAVKTNTAIKSNTNATRHTNTAVHTQSKVKTNAPKVSSAPKVKAAAPKAKAAPRAAPKKPGQ
jgi:hypothetical protein